MDTAQDQLHVFQSTSSEPVPLESDPVVKLEAQYKRLKDFMHYGPLLLVLIVGFIVAMAVLYSIRHADPMTLLSCTGGFLPCLLFGIRALQLNTWYQEAKEELESTGNVIPMPNFLSFTTLAIHLFVAFFIPLFMLFFPDFHIPSFILALVLGLLFLLLTIYIGFRNRKIYMFDNNLTRAPKWKPYYYVLFILFVVITTAVCIFKAVSIF